MDKVEQLRNLKYGDVIRFTEGREPFYFIVEMAEGRYVQGSLINPTGGLNRFTIDELVKKQDLSIAEWKELE